MDCLVIGNRRDYWNPFIILPELSRSSVEGCTQLVTAGLSDSQSMNHLLEQQRARLHWFAWVRPLRQLESLARNCRRSLSIMGKRKVAA
jgi:hypothetical protein